MLTLLTALLLTAAFLGASTGTLVHALGASMPETPDGGALLLGRVLAGLGQVCAVTAAAALLHRHTPLGTPLAWLTVLAAIAVTTSLTTGRRVTPTGRHRATSNPTPA